MKLENVTGIKILYPTGFFSSYFDYNADRNTLLEKISSLPFSIDAAVADMQCQALSFDDLDLLNQKMSAAELENAAPFWSIGFSDLEIYQCIKPPYKHTILTHKNSNRILHRIEFVG